MTRPEPTGLRLPSISFRRDDGLPKYIAISRAIALAIVEQEIEPGEMLPPQKELAESFGVTLMTVRQAIQVLVERGLVMTTQGKGTYVRSQPYRLPLGSLASFAAQITDSGRSLRTEVLGYTLVTVSPIEQRRMSLPSDEAFELVRLRYVDDEPLVLQTSLLPPAIGGGLDAAVLENRSLYEVLYSDLGIRIDHATETLQASLLDEDSAEMLRRRPGDAALLSARLTFDDGGRAVVDDRALIAGDKVVVSADRRPDGPGVSLMFTSDAPEVTDASTPFVRGGRRTRPRTPPAHQPAQSEPLKKPVRKQK